MCLPNFLDSGSLSMTGEDPAIAAKAGTPETGTLIGNQ
jgi:hypothetical protein